MKSIGDSILDSISPEVKEVLRSAARLENRGDKVGALFLRNTAWRMDTGKEWLDDIQTKEQN